VTVATRSAEGDWEDEDEFRKSLDLTRRVDWFVFTCSVAGKRIVAYARDAICPVRCDSFTLLLLPARK
jgi:hypothetical protein